MRLAEVTIRNKTSQVIYIQKYQKKIGFRICLYGIDVCSVLFPVKYVSRQMISYQRRRQIMATNFQEKLNQLQGETRTGLPDISDYSILVTNSNTDPNNPATNIPFGQQFYDYRIIEHLNPSGYDALSHEVIDYSGASVIYGDVGGHTFVNTGLNYDPDSTVGNTGPLVPTAGYTYKGCLRSKVDIVHAQGGNDIVYGYTGNDKLYGEGGDDILLGGTGNDLLDGGTGIDFLFGDAGNDTLYGGTQDDYLEGGTGDDVLNGGNGDDVLFGQAGADTLKGDANNDILNGGEDNDQLWGGTGDDVLIGGAGADELRGDDGTDLASYATAAGPVIVSLADPSGNTGDAAGDTYISIEGVIGTANADTLTGDDNDNLIAGGAGADALDGGAGFDTLDYSTSSAAVVVSLAEQAASGGDAQGDTLAGFEAVIGSNYNDTLTGDAGNNTLKGGAGTDVLTGNAGADILDGGSGVDFANYNLSAAGISIDLANNVISGGDAQGDTLIGIEGIIGTNYDDTLQGNAESNTFFGGAGADAIYGGDGDDLISGGAGADTLAGGDGTDRLNYGASTAAVTINLANGGANGGDAEGDTISGFEQVSGSERKKKKKKKKKKKNPPAPASLQPLEGGGNRPKKTKQRRTPIKKKN
eukprot:TRINITY_DN28472_c0_g2_i1.p4 TRINITY_DN28472_c0_g2~~TRINITY_DN28472_c0_g2_i1.p4  ORF type:complete len:641 (-),score=199.44 TRINITY_DN28472_c0_g2_i1:101-2023(-)